MRVVLVTSGQQFGKACRLKSAVHKISSGHVLSPLLPQTHIKVGSLNHRHIDLLAPWTPVALIMLPRLLTLCLHWWVPVNHTSSIKYMSPYNVKLGLNQPLIIPSHGSSNSSHHQMPPEICRSLPPFSSLSDKFHSAITWFIILYIPRGVSPFTQRNTLQ